MISTTECRQCHLIYAGEHHCCPIKVFNDIMERVDIIRKTLVSDKQMYDEKQYRKVWQEGAERYMSAIDKRVREIEGKMNPKMFMNFTPVIYDEWPTIKPYQGILSKAFRGTSQKHLEKCLKEKNDRIKILEEQLGNRNNECQNALNRVNMLEHEIKAWQREYNGAQEILDNRQKGFAQLSQESMTQARTIKDLQEELRQSKNALECAEKRVDIRQEIIQSQAVTVNNQQEKIKEIQETYSNLAKAYENLRQSKMHRTIYDLS